MRVLLLSKTRMNNGRCCIGGVSNEGQYVRLFRNDGRYYTEEEDLAVGQIWDITYTVPQNNPPHIEDIRVNKKTLHSEVGDARIVEIIDELDLPIWQGSPANLFNNKLKWTNAGSGYIDRGDIPDHSVGFWRPDVDFHRYEYEGKIRYRNRFDEGWRHIKYVGFVEPIALIPAGTLLRVSLARWWTNQNTDMRCYLQLSGWYNL